MIYKLHKWVSISGHRDASGDRWSWTCRPGGADQGGLDLGMVKPMNSYITSGLMMKNIVILWAFHGILWWFNGI